ncbi:MAG: hypothetical protein ABI652_02635 [Acidobacteriota bacterium]
MSTMDPSITRLTLVAREARGLSRAALLLALCLAARSVLVVAQSAPAATPDLAGGWLRVDEGSGSFDGTAAKYPSAALTAAGQAMAIRGDGRNLIPTRAADAPANQAGQAYIVNTAGCTPDGSGGNAINPNSTAVFLLQSRDEVLMVREGPGGRHFYLDGRRHPEAGKLPPSMYGHSVGHYEAGALVVETVGLTEGTVQGGGKRRPETRLIERFQLSADSKRLTIVYTWDDPVIYIRPHTYETVFERLPEESYAFETWCDSSDPLQRQSIVPPKQVP